MKNVKMEVKGNILTVTIDLSQNLGKSASGKSDLVGTTHGNVIVPGSDVTIGVNAYRRAA